MVPGSDGWHDVESRWLKPPWRSCVRAFLARVELSADDRCFTLNVQAIRRFWRRRKTVWEFFA